MSHFVKGLIAATIILGVALSSRAGLIPQDVANTLVIVLPLVLVMAMTRGSCVPRSKEA